MSENTKVSVSISAEPLLTFFPTPEDDAVRIGAPLKKTSGEPTEVAVVFDLYTHLAKKLVELPRTAAWNSTRKTQPRLVSFF